MLIDSVKFLKDNLLSLYTGYVEIDIPHGRMTANGFEFLRLISESGEDYLHTVMCIN